MTMLCGKCGEIIDIVDDKCRCSYLVPAEVFHQQEQAQEFFAVANEPIEKKKVDGHLGAVRA